MAENHPVFGIAHNQLALDILPRKIRSHIKLAGIARLPYSLRRSEKFDLVAKLNRVAPPRDQLGVAWVHLAVDLNGFGLQKERSRTAQRNLRLAYYASKNADRARFSSEFASKAQRRRIARPQAVQEKEASSYEGVNRQGIARKQRRRGQDYEHDRKRQRMIWREVGNKNTGGRRQGHSNERLAR